VETSNCKSGTYIYLDHAATTPLLPEALSAMMPCLKEDFGNASSGYGLGSRSRKYLRQAREKIAETLKASPEEIFFTSGGTESDNWAVKGSYFAALFSGRIKPGSGHMITSRIEHPAVLSACRMLEQMKIAVTYLEVDQEGRIDFSQLAHSFRSDTFLVSIQYANNEVGTIQPVADIAALCREHHVPFHTDAVQAYGHIPLGTADGFDLLSASAHKFGGPKGCGFLYVKSGVDINPLFSGGGQELGKRSGTENVAGIVGMAAAAAVMTERQKEMEEKCQKMQKLLWQGLKESIPGVRLNGMALSSIKRLPGNVNVSFPDTEAQELLGFLDRNKICASGGSACSTLQRHPSHVLQAMGLPDKQIQGSVRMTLGADNTEEEIRIVVKRCEEYFRTIK